MHRLRAGSPARDRARSAPAASLWPRPDRNREGGSCPRRRRSGGSTRVLPVAHPWSRNLFGGAIGMAASQAVERPNSSRTVTVGAQVSGFLDEHSEMAHKPAEVAKALGVKIGSAKREVAAWRNRQKSGRFGPVFIQRVHLKTRTPPETVYPGSPPAEWQDRGDNKLTRSGDLPPDGHLDILWPPNG